MPVFRGGGEWMIKWGEAIREMLGTDDISLGEAEVW